MIMNNANVYWIADEFEGYIISGFADRDGNYVFFESKGAKTYLLYDIPEWLFVVAKESLQINQLLYEKKKHLLDYAILSKQHSDSEIMQLYKLTDYDFGLLKTVYENEQCFEKELKKIQPIEEKLQFSGKYKVNQFKPYLTYSVII